MSKYPKPSWKVRRRLVIATLLFSAFCILWVMFSKDTRPVAEIIVMTMVGLFGSTLGSYIFGAVWDDNNYMKALKPKSDNVTSSQWQSDHIQEVPLNNDELG